MHRRVYGRNGDVVILLCVIPPSTHPLLLIKFDKVFIAQIYFEIFKRPPIIFFFFEFTSNGFFAPFVIIKENKECRKIISKPKINRIFIDSRNYIQGRKQQKFQLGTEIFIPSHYAIIHICLLPQFMTMVCHPVSLQTLLQSRVLISRCKKKSLYINVDLLESSQIGVIFILCIYRVYHIVHRCHTWSLLLIQAIAFESLFILRCSVQRYSVIFFFLTYFVLSFISVLRYKFIAYQYLVYALYLTVFIYIESISLFLQCKCIYTCYKKVITVNTF